ncbi:hypothetical protein FRC03_000160 [Tulasnella sp. 419]|nr:hypothetical protein FRC03_000160 [Tulasnella sp. 419]
MLSVSTWHAPSSVSHSVRCRFISDGAENLIVGRLNRIEVYALSPTGSVLQTSFDTWGTMTSLNAVRRHGHNTDSLIITIDHRNPSFLILDYDDEASRVFVSHNISLRMRGAREAEFFNGAIVHPNGNVIVTHVYTGHLKVMVLGENPNKIESEFECRIPELNVHSLCFIPVSGTKLSLAILYEDHNSKMRIIARDLNLRDKELSFEQSSMLVASLTQENSKILLPISTSRKTGVVLSLGGGYCHVFGSERLRVKRESRGSQKAIAVNSTANCKLPHTSDLCYTYVDEARVLLADASGILSILEIGRNNTGEVTTIHCESFGKINPATCISNIADYIFFVGSHYGDSQVIRIVPEPKEDQGYVEILESMPNISPIMDAVLADLDGSGHNQVVTCSGGSTSGSLRIIRTGAEFKQTAVLDAIPFARRIFPLRSTIQASEDHRLLVSTAFNSILLDVRNSNFEEIEGGPHPGIQRARPTLAACTIVHPNCAVQVTSEGVFVVDLVTDALLEKWLSTRGAEITAATVNPTQVCVALRGGKMILFSVKDGAIKAVAEKQFETTEGLPQEISSLSIAPLTRANLLSSNVVVVGFWHSNRVTLYSLPGFQAKWSVEESHVARSILLHSFSQDPGSHLLLSLGDGSVVSYGISQMSITNRKAVNLGSNPVTLCPCILNDLGKEWPVVAVGERATVLSLKKGRVHNSPMPLKDVTAISSLNSAFHQNSLMIMTESTTIIGRIGALEKLNIRSIPLGVDAPVKIAHHPTYNVFGVGCVRSEYNQDTGVETRASSLKIVDAVSSETIQSIPCSEDEEVTCVSIAVLGRQDPTEYFVLGTAVAPIAGAIESSSGRVLLLDKSNLSIFEVIAQVDVPGCVYGIAYLEGKVAIAVNSSVLLYNFEKSKSGGVRLTQISKWDRAYLIVSIVSRGNNLIVADPLRSVDILELDGEKLASSARDYAPLGPAAVESISDGTTIASQLDRGLVLMRREGSRLERAGSMHYGEMINKMVSGSLIEGTSHSGVKPTLLLFTSSGRISVVSTVESVLALRLTAVQRNLGNIIKGPGGLEHSTWRTPIRPNGTTPYTFAGFLDGDFIERFLDLSEEEAEETLRGRNEAEKMRVSREEVIEMVESLVVSN